MDARSCVSVCAVDAFASSWRKEFSVRRLRWFGAGWVAASVVFGIACTPQMVWLARRLDSLARDCGRVLDDIAGRRMADAWGR